MRLQSLNMPVYWFFIVGLTESKYLCMLLMVLSFSLAASDLKSISIIFALYSGAKTSLDGALPDDSLLQSDWTVDEAMLSSSGRIMGLNPNISRCISNRIVVVSPSF